jgi:hypothetical protein
MMAKSENTRYRWEIAARATAAAIGGYAVSALFTAVLTHFLALPRADAVLVATMLGFLLYAIVAMVAFYVRSVPRLWIALAAACAALGTVLFLTPSPGSVA